MDSRLGNYYFNKLENVCRSESTQHYHAAYEIYYLSQGACNYFIGEGLFEVEEGDLVMIPAGTIHRTNYSSETHSRMIINVSSEYIPKKIAEALSSVGYLYRNKKTQKEIENILSKIENEYERADEFSKEALKCYTQELLLLVIRNMEGNEIQKAENSLIDSAVRYIRGNYMNDIRLADVAKNLSVSSEHLSRTFKKETGFGFCEYVTLLRLKNAEFMLKNEPGQTVGSVAYACGFNDSNYFSYKFKEAYGVSPMKVRAEAKHSAKKKCNEEKT